MDINTMIRCALIACLMALSGQAMAGPDIQHWVSDSGARVYFVPSDDLPMVDIRLVFAAGSSRSSGQPGLAKMTSRLLDEGAGDWTANQVSEQFDNVGARFGSGALRDMAWLSLRTLTDPVQLDPAMRAFEAVLGQPQFGAEAIERIRQSMLIQLDRSDESPSSIGAEKFMAGLYGAHPYATSTKGTRASLRAFTRDDIVKFYKRYYVARNVVIAIVGDMTRVNAEAMVNRLMAGVGRGERASGLPAVAKLGSSKPVFIEHSSTQTHVYIGQPGIARKHPDQNALYVGNYVLGGSGLVSRLSDEVREKRGLSYSVYSYFLPMESRGPFQMKLQTKNEQRDEAVQVMLNTLNDYLETGPSDKELLAAKRGITGGFALRLDSNKKLVEQLASIGFYDLALDYLDTYKAKIMALTRDEVHQAMLRHLSPERMVQISVGGAVSEVP